MNPILGKVYEFVKPWLGKALVVVAIFAGGYLLGWRTKPAEVRVEERLKVEQVEKIVERVVERVVERESSNSSHDANTNAHVHRETVTTKSPDGTVVTKKTEDINVDKVVKDVEIRTVEVEKVVVQDRVVEVEKIVEREKIVVEKQRADWHLGPMVGLDVTHVDLKGAFLAQPWAVGGEVERRIIGPVYLGVWGLSSGQVGLKVSAEF